MRKEGRRGKEMKEEVMADPKQGLNLTLVLLIDRPRKDG